MKLEITGLVNNIGGIRPTKNGFQQTVILHIPEVKDEMDTLTRREQFYPIQIWSREQTDKRFLSPKDIKSKKKAVVYMRGERWMNDGARDFSYNVKLNLNEWGK
jgi:hypothetical protein